jgi:hypothetical protein
MNSSSRTLKKEIILPLVGLKAKVDPEAVSIPASSKKKVVGAILLLLGTGLIVSFFYIDRGFLGWTALGVGILLALTGFGCFLRNILLKKN